MGVAELGGANWIRIRVGHTELELSESSFGIKILSSKQAFVLVLLWVFLLKHKTDETMTFYIREQLIPGKFLFFFLRFIYLYIQRE